MVAIMVAIISTIGVIAQTWISKQSDMRNAEVVKKNEDLLEKIESNRRELINKIDYIGVSDCKNFLVTMFGKIDSGKTLSTEEIKRLYEVYDVYENEYHKNSYIHDKFEKLREEKKI